jgi:uncharacterized protein YkwD
MEPIKIVALGLTLFAASQGFPADQIISKPRPTATRNAADLFTGYDAASFAKLPQARQLIDPDAVNLDLLDAAVFHETNRRRRQQGLPALKYDEKARAAAQIQSRDMAKGGFVDHENPDPTKKTMNDRAKLAGLRPRVLAENVASAFGRRYKSGQPFYSREENGQKIYSAEPNGRPIPMHTYLSFAEALLDSWMKSPGHRKNILHGEVEYLGCACELPRNPNAMETFYCTQVFFTPLDLPSR